MAKKRKTGKSVLARRQRRRSSRLASRQPSKKATNDKALREHVLYLLRGGGAHLDFEKAVDGLPDHLRGVKPSGVPFTAWRLLEHLRFAQRDILEFSKNPKYVSPDWPAGYWPEGDAPTDGAAWDQSVKSFRADLQAVEKLVADPSTDLYARIPHGTGQTILREALLVADHNAYHLGQIVLLRRLLRAWPDE
jgi:hypothetical protein